MSDSNNRLPVNPTVSPAVNPKERPIENKIREKIILQFNPIHFVLENESHNHSVPQNSETHFRLVLVASQFEGVARLKRQRLVYECLKEEMQPGLVHALTLRVLTPQEWADSGKVEVASPPCLGGEKKT